MNNMNDNDENLIHSKEELERVISENNLVLLYFSSKNCTVCHAVYPKLVKLIQLEELPIKVVKVLLDELLEISGQYLVFSVPTVLILDRGKEVLRESRFIDLDKILRLIHLYK